MKSTALVVTAAFAAAFLLTGCDRSPVEPAVVQQDESAQDAFWNTLTALCGQPFEGTIAANEGAGAGPDPFEGRRLLMQVRECSDTEIRVPFHVGEDRSRTWVFTRTDTGLRLKHDHRHEDGSDDALTMYGGDTADAGTARTQSFPADEYSRELFVREGIPQSVPNVWVVTVMPGERYSYTLRRPGREFTVDFDLTAPVPAPPAPWGWDESR
jgi:hypothetical protein